MFIQDKIIEIKESRDKYLLRRKDKPVKFKIESNFLLLFYFVFILFIILLGKQFISIPFIMIKTNSFNHNKLKFQIYFFHYIKKIINCFVNDNISSSIEDEFCYTNKGYDLFISFIDKALFSAFNMLYYYFIGHIIVFSGCGIGIFSSIVDLKYAKNIIYIFFTSINAIYNLSFKKILFSNDFINRKCSENFFSLFISVFLDIIIFVLVLIPKNIICFCNMFNSQEIKSDNKLFYIYILLLILFLLFSKIFILLLEDIMKSLSLYFFYRELTDIYNVITNLLFNANFFYNFDNFLCNKIDPIAISKDQVSYDCSIKENSSKENSHVNIIYSLSLLENEEYKELFIDQKTILIHKLYLDDNKKNSFSYHLNSIVVNLKEDLIYSFSKEMELLCNFLPEEYNDTNIKCSEKVIIKDFLDSFLFKDFSIDKMTFNDEAYNFISELYELFYKNGTIFEVNELENIFNQRFHFIKILNIYKKFFHINTSYLLSQMITERKNIEIYLDNYFVNFLCEEYTSLFKTNSTNSFDEIVSKLGIRKSLLSHLIEDGQTNIKFIYFTLMKDNLFDKFTELEIINFLINFPNSSLGFCPIQKFLENNYFVNFLYSAYKVKGTFSGIYIEGKNENSFNEECKNFQHIFFNFFIIIKMTYLKQRGKEILIPSVTGVIKDNENPFKKFLDFTEAFDDNAFNSLNIQNLYYKYDNIVNNHSLYYLNNNIIQEQNSISNSNNFNEPSASSFFNELNFDSHNFNEQPSASSIRNKLNFDFYNFNEQPSASSIRNKLNFDFPSANSILNEQEFYYISNVVVQKKLQNQINEKLNLVINFDEDNDDSDINFDEDNDDSDIYFVTSGNMIRNSFFKMHDLDVINGERRRTGNREKMCEEGMNAIIEMLYYYFNFISRRRYSDPKELKKDIIEDILYIKGKYHLNIEKQTHEFIKYIDAFGVNNNQIIEEIKHIIGSFSYPFRVNTLNCVYRLAMQMQVDFFRTPFNDIVNMLIKSSLSFKYNIKFNDISENMPLLINTINNDKIYYNPIILSILIDNTSVIENNQIQNMLPNYFPSLLLDKDKEIFYFIAEHLDFLKENFKIIHSNSLNGKILFHNNNFLSIYYDKFALLSYLKYSGYKKVKIVNKFIYTFIYNINYLSLIKMMLIIILFFYINKYVYNFLTKFKFLYDKFAISNVSALQEDYYYEFKLGTKSLKLFFMILGPMLLSFVSDPVRSADEQKFIFLFSIINYKINCQEIVKILYLGSNKHIFSGGIIEYCMYNKRYFIDQMFTNSSTAYNLSYNLYNNLYDKLISKTSFKEFEKNSFLEFVLSLIFSINLNMSKLFDIDVASLLYGDVVSENCKKFINFFCLNRKDRSKIEISIKNFFISKMGKSLIGNNVFFDKIKVSVEYSFVVKKMFFQSIIIISEMFLLIASYFIGKCYDLFINKSFDYSLGFNSVLVDKKNNKIISMQFNKLKNDMYIRIYSLIFVLILRFILSFLFIEISELLIILSFLLPIALDYYHIRQNEKHALSIFQ